MTEFRKLLEENHGTYQGKHKSTHLPETSHDLLANVNCTKESEEVVRSAHSSV